jgi:competence protein ComEC
MNPAKDASLRELLDPLRGFWFCLGGLCGWLAFAMPWPFGVATGIVVAAWGLLFAASRGSRLAILVGLVLQVSVFQAWEVVPAPADLEGEFRVVVERRTAPGKGECRILSSPDRALEGRRVRCEGGLGDTLGGRAKLRALHPPTNPGGFDARMWGASSGMEGFLVWADDSVVRRTGPVPLGEGARRWTESVVTRSLASRMEASAAAMWTATLLARNDALPRGALDAFRQSGLFHMLSVSGFHMAVLGGGLVVLLSLLRVGRRLSWLLAALVVVGYSWLLSFPPPVSRSTVAFVALALAMATGRRPHARNSFFLAAGAILILGPDTPFLMGAQLTFVATAALLWGTPALTKFVPLRWRRGRIHDWFVAPVCASLAATLATAPILAWHVGTVAWIGIPAGLVSAGAFAVGFLAALATVFLAWLPAWCSWGFAGAAEGAARLVYEVALRAGQWGPGSLVVGRPDPWILASCLLLLVLLFFTARRSVSGKAWVGMGLVALATFAYAWRPIPPRMRLVVLDVGQGSAAIARWPSGRSWLVDAGPGAHQEGGRDAGRDVILPAMKILGIGTFDLVVLSHADFDHVGGLAYLADRIPSTTMLLSTDSGTPPSGFFDSLRTSLVTRGWTVRKAGAGQILSYGDGARCEVVAPGFGEPVPRNQSSLVLRFGFDSARALIPGDADSVSEAFQMASGAGLRSQVLVAGHHGSKHSSSLAWLKLVQPREAILSYGATNRYGHPHPDVLERLDSVGARAWRTPLGAVTVELSGRGVRIEERDSSWWRGPWRRRDLSFGPQWTWTHP